MPSMSACQMVIKDTKEISNAYALHHRLCFEGISELNALDGKYTNSRNVRNRLVCQAPGDMLQSVEPMDAVDTRKVIWSKAISTR